MSIARALVVKQHVESGRAEADVRGIEQSIRAIERFVTTVDGMHGGFSLNVDGGELDQLDVHADPSVFDLILDQLRNLLELKWSWRLLPME